MRLLAEIKTVGIVQAGHYYNVGDVVEVNPEPQNDIYYPARRVDDGLLQALKSHDFEILEEPCYG